MNQDFNPTPSNDELQKVVEAFKPANIDVVIVNNASEALQKVKDLIPEGEEVHTAASTTLNQIGFMDFVQSGESKWKYLGKLIHAETDPVKRSKLRRQSIGADYFIGGVNAITEDGKLVLVDASGSRVSGYAHAAGKVIIVSGTNKIVKNLDEAFKRIREYVFPLENERAKEAYGSGSAFGKWLIIEKDAPERTKLILIKEKLGF